MYGVKNYTLRHNEKQPRGCIPGAVLKEEWGAMYQAMVNLPV